MHPEINGAFKKYINSLGKEIGEPKNFFEYSAAFAFGFSMHESEGNIVIQPSIDSITKVQIEESIPYVLGLLGQVNSQVANMSEMDKKSLAINAGLSMSRINSNEPNRIIQAKYPSTKLRFCIFKQAYEQQFMKNIIPGYTTVYSKVSQFIPDVDSPEFLIELGFTSEFMRKRGYKPVFLN